MTELEIEKLERNLTEYDSYKKKERSDDDAGSNLGEVVTALEADGEIDDLEKEEVAITEEIAEALERRQKDKLPALRDIPKKELLEETAKVDKVLCKFKTHSITKTNELFYAGAVVVTNRLGIRLIRQRREKNQCGGGGYKIRLKS